MILDLQTHSSNISVEICPTTIRTDTGIPGIAHLAYEPKVTWYGGEPHFGHMFPSATKRLSYKRSGYPKFAWPYPNINYSHHWPTINVMFVISICMVIILGSSLRCFRRRAVLKEMLGCSIDRARVRL